MACDVTLGRLEGCKSFVGGIKAVYFINYGSMGAVTIGTSDEISDLAGTFSAYKYDIKGAGNNLEQQVVSSRDNGTTYWSQILNLQFKGLSKEDNKQVKLLAYGRPHIVVEDNNGNAMLVGLERGAEVTGGTIVTGVAMGDLSGYTLNFTGEEKLPANFINGAVAGDPFAGIITGVITIVEGA